ncbi:MAG: putative O-glycosylation ligase, exosortase A system-associated [Methylomonas sp.]|nr:putative O-glycosylation ligase, exosortase A system-associated [Methylomonas sp.]PPD22105.1 MAG: putative O-glycosylation ligase, exosortase A system-associated [Methylomonas sp.]PPD42408.1 MAG: putative O-glycosylation ligase, exosortase A system-associated [Methylomonas sp.]PPD53118.1 MAG: putative O-glycosylation ligase, exosortase A system-associated [Methylomonas sp.]
MRDIFVLILIAILIIASLKRPWWGVLSLAIFSYMNPHSYAWGFVRSLPAYYILFLAVCISYFKSDEKQSIFFDWRVKFFIALWVYFGLTTLFALVPNAAEQKFIDVSKIFFPFFFTLSLITTREKLFYLIATIASSIGLIALKGGLFALASGFSHRVYGPPATQYAGNNEFALVTIIIIPLLILFQKQTNNKNIKLLLLFAIPVCIASAISSWSRGALLALVGSGFYLLLHSKYKLLAIPLIICSVYFLLPYLPESWFARMHTLETYDEDESALGRLEAWHDGWNYATAHPFLGAGFDGWIMVTQRDWHSAYVEIFSEHGFIAFGIWISLILGSLISLTRLQIKFKSFPELKWVGDYSISLKAAIFAYMIGSAFLGVSYWDLLYHLIFISALVKKFALEEFETLQNSKIHLKTRNHIDQPKHERYF